MHTVHGMFLNISTNGREVMLHGDPEGLEDGSISDPAQLHNLRGLYGTTSRLNITMVRRGKYDSSPCADHHFSLSPNFMDLTIIFELHASGFHPRGDNDLRHVGFREDLQVLSAGRRIQIALRNIFSEVRRYSRPSRVTYGNSIRPCPLHRIHDRNRFPGSCGLST